MQHAEFGHEQSTISFVRRLDADPSGFILTERRPEVPAGTVALRHLRPAWAAAGRPVWVEADVANG